MKILSIDVGNYEIKFLAVTIQRYQINYDDFRSTRLPIAKENLGPLLDISNLDVKFQAIHEYLKNKSDYNRIIINAPTSLIANRFLELPIKSRKKVDLIIPHQLEQDLPYSSVDVHWSRMIFPFNNKSSVLISLINKNKFRHFFDFFRTHKIEADIITSEISILQNYILNNDNIPIDSFCIIDFGHLFTKFYFISQRKINSYHISTTAGLHFNEVIAKSYKISVSEAQAYKHKNAFLLTSKYTKNVSEDQFHFAKIMEQTIAPIIDDYQKWSLGHQIQTGKEIEKIYITGGQSLIKNLPSFLQEKTGSSVDFFQNLDPLLFQSAPDNKKNIGIYYNQNILQIHSFRKNKNYINFRIGEFAPTSRTHLPLHSLAFNVTRILIISLFVMTTLLVENIYLSKKISSLDKKVVKILTNPQLNVGRRERRYYKRTPEKIHKKLLKKVAQLEDELKFLDELSGLDGLEHLESLSSLDIPDIKITEYESNNESTQMSFQSKDAKILEALTLALKNIFNKSPLKTNINANSLRVTIQR